MAALTATGLSLLWLSSVLNRRAEAEPHHNSCASSLPCQTHEQRSKGGSLYLYSEFRASLLCSRNLRAAGGSCPPQLRITKSDKTPQLLAASTPPRHTRTLHPRSAAQAAQHPSGCRAGYSQHPAPSLPAQHLLAFARNGAGSSLCPSGVPVRVHKKLPVPTAVKVFSEKQRRLQARV